MYNKNQKLIKFFYFFVFYIKKLKDIINNKKTNFIRPPSFSYYFNLKK